MSFYRISTTFYDFTLDNQPLGIMIMKTKHDGKACTYSMLEIGGK
jgi:hypothetical protein